MTAQPIELEAPAVDTTNLLRLAGLYANQQVDGFAAHLTLVRITGRFLSEETRWAHFEDLVDGLRKLGGDWRDIEPDLTCTDRGAAADDIAMERIDQAVHSLTAGKGARH